MANKYKNVNGKLVKLNSKELAQLKIDEETNKKLLEEEKKQEEDRESAKTKLKKLGLTDNEIKTFIKG